MMPPDPDQPDDTRSEEDPGNRLLKELAHDAKIVAAYAARAGLLKSAALPDAIAGLNPEENLSWRDPSVVKLQTALSATILDLAPTTLHDLKGPGAPFKTEAMTRYSVAFVVSWAIIIFIVAWGTLSHNFGLSIRSSLEELKEDGTRVRIEELVRSVVSNTRTLDVTTIADGLVSGADSGSAGEAFTDFAVASAFLVHLDEARALDEKTYTTVSNATKFIEENIILRLIVSPIGTLQSFFLFGANPTQLQYSLCSNQDEDAPEPVWRTNSGVAIANAIKLSDAEGISLTCIRNFNYNLWDYPPLQHYIDLVNLILNVYGLWLLPALYGALGASMYHLRRTLNPTLPTPSPLRTVNRTIMGSFAGIVIAWFWAPAAQANAEVINIGFNLFVIAFLIGYSIDIFFTFVDRILVTATGTIARLGANEK